MAMAPPASDSISRFTSRSASAAIQFDSVALQLMQATQAYTHLMALMLWLDGNMMTALAHQFGP
jgi:hypothetical protein